MKILCSTELSPEDRALIEAEANKALAEHNAQSPTGGGHYIKQVTVLPAGEDWEMHIKYGQEIRRIRRITGYMSETDRWNDAKIAELRDRKSHV